MHAKDTPFQFLIREISNISGLTAHPPRAEHDYKTRGLTPDHTPGATASYLTTNFAGTTTGGGVDRGQ
jgi:hypothetical protein